MQTLSLRVTSEKPKVLVNDNAITAAPSVEEMFAVLGNPSRVDSGASPAPAGHRNNQIHVFDSLGVTINEHHYAYRVQSLQCWFNTGDPEFRFTPTQDFTGLLKLDDVEMPPGGDVRDFLASSPFKFEGGFGGSWHYRFDGYCVFVSSRGRLLRSGRRSQVRHVTSVSLAWPHDPWQE